MQQRDFAAPVSMALSGDLFLERARSAISSLPLCGDTGVSGHSGGVRATSSHMGSFIVTCAMWGSQVVSSPTTHLHPHGASYQTQTAPWE